MASTKKYLDPDLVARLRGLRLRARGMAAGMVTGLHRSPYHGFSVEFAEHRQYSPGDDIRYLDWRIFGRQDRFYIKQYEEETNLRAEILVDASRSMAYGAAGPSGLSKFDYGCKLAASLAYLLVSQQDAVGLITFDNKVRSRLAAAMGKRHLGAFVAILEETEPDRETDVKILFHRLAEELRKRAMVVLISDLLADPDDVVLGLEHICHAGHETIVFHVMDDHEWTFPFIDNVQFEGLESNERLLVDPQALQASYLEALRGFVTRVQTACLKHRADYVPVNTREAIEGVLTGYLARRSGLAAGGTR